jgi:histidinol-phosphate aminotransferase
MPYSGSSEEHGGVDPRELKRHGVDPAGLIDFSVNSNPFGPSPRVLAAIRGVDVSRYPDRECSALRERLAEANRTSADEILVGNGTAELIWLAAHAFLRPGDPVLIVGPTFGEYRRASQAVGARVVEIRAQAEDFLPPIEAILAALAGERFRMVFLCNPNNPTGQVLDEADLHTLADHSGPDTLLVLDEAYRTFTGRDFFAPPPVENCLTLRSMTKDFALAGLRLGYVMANAERVNAMRQLQPAWSVNAFALAAGQAAIADREFYRHQLEELPSLKKELFAQIAGKGVRICASQTHFGLLRFPQPAVEIRRRLLQERIQVRDCASLGLPYHVRIATRLKDDNRRLLDALTSSAGPGSLNS